MLSSQYNDNTHLNKRSSRHLRLDDLLGFNEVGRVAFWVDSAHVVARSSAQARAARHDRVGEGRAADRTWRDFNNCEIPYEYNSVFTMQQL